MTGDEGLIEHLKTDYRQADLGERDRVMLDYAAKLTREPWHMTKEDVAALQKAGFDDRDILDINQIAGYFAFVNRLADGLGVALEAYWEDGKIKKE